MAFLELHGLTKRFSNFIAVEQMDLAVQRGEFLSLLGPSGCGKTTTLHMIAGFQQPSAGALTMEGRDIVDVPVHRRDIGIVFQNYALFPHLTVEKNVSFGLEMRKVPPAERKERVANALDMVHLGHLGQRYPKELSGGQQQRVALARALVIEPKMLLLDEPLSNLDAKLREDMQIELKLLQRKLGITTILVTHDQNEAMALSDRIAVMHAGRIAQLGEPLVSYEHPSSLFVAGFLGKANLIPVEIRACGEDTVSFQIGSRALTMAAPCWQGSQAHLSLRPEKISFCTAEEGYLEGRLAARILQGSTWLYQVTTETYGPIYVCEQNRLASPREEGSIVHLKWMPEHARLLPPET